MGAAGWVALAATGPYALGLIPLEPIPIAAGALLCAGAALLPDADHGQATIAHSLPPLSKMMCDGIGKISGGHRHGTHSFLGTIAFTALALGAGFLGPVGIVLIATPLLAFAFKVLKVVRGPASCWITALAGAVALAFFVTAPWWYLPLTVALGCLIHILGDALTVGGVTPFWPWVPKPKGNGGPCWQKNGYMGLPFLGKTGGVREWIFLIPITAYAAWGIADGIAVLCGADLTDIALTALRALA